ncbi:MAG: hypothetical protein IJH79_20740 [Lentisphaeria bacterium]|nr:hypothetical protein [Lentisphaeria bacterium]
MANAYRWASGSRHRVSPEIAGSVCDQLAKDNNLCAQSLVDVSRPESAPLHNEFEWDDAKAGEEWRKAQAGNVIRHLIIVREEPETKEEQTPIRAFFKIEHDDPHYTPVEIIIRKEDTRNALIAQAINELKAFRRKYAAISELAKLFESIDSEMEQIEIM